jgi:hypothetical protein
MTIKKAPCAGGGRRRRVSRNYFNTTWSILLFGSLVSGCAFSNVEVRLSTEATSAYSGGQDRPLAISSFVDQRPIKGRIGMQKNGYGMDTANAVADQSVDAWLTARLAGELRSAGFQIVSDGAAPNATKINGQVLKLFVEPVQQWSTVDVETDLSVRIQVTRPDGFQAERQYFVKAVDQGMASLSGAYTASVSKATEVLMKRIVVDVINLMNKFP